MEPTDSLLIEIFGIKAVANGQFAIAAVLLALLVAGTGYAAGRRLEWW